MTIITRKEAICNFCRYFRQIKGSNVLVYHNTAKINEEDLHSLPKQWAEVTSAAARSCITTGHSTLHACPDCKEKLEELLQLLGVECSNKHDPVDQTFDHSIIIARRLK